MLLRLLAALIIVPLVEVYLLLQLADATSVWVTITIVVLTGVLGSFLARREGVIAWARFRSALAQGRMPSREIQDGLMVVVAAALLLTPGFLTDAVGFLMLLPAGRDLVRRLFLNRYLSGSGARFGASTLHGRPLYRSGETIDAEKFEPRR